MNGAFRDRKREVVLALILATCALVRLGIGAGTKSEDVPGMPVVPSAKQVLNEYLLLQRSGTELSRTLLARKQRWAAQQQRMLLHQPVAVTLTSVSHQLEELATDNGLDVSAAPVTVDSAGAFLRVRSRITVRGDAWALISFIESVTLSEVRIRIRSIQLARINPASAGESNWSGTLDVESLVRPEPR